MCSTAIGWWLGNEKGWSAAGGHKKYPPAPLACRVNPRENGASLLQRVRPVPTKAASAPTAQE